MMHLSCRTIAVSLAVLSLHASLIAGAEPRFPSEFANEPEVTGRAPGEPPLARVPDRLHEPRGAQRRPIVRRIIAVDDSGAARYAEGGLTGTSVYLSPGHGWTYTATNGWHTQRPNTFGVVEDLSNGDGIAQFLVPYLLAAGALVVPVREIDPTPHMVILDNSDGTGDPARGITREEGAAELFLDSTLAGWGHPALPLTGSTNPFTLGGNRLMYTSPTETARVVFVPNVPESGHYNVYISYSMYEGRASDARVTVAHDGGEALFEVNQRRHGSTWLLLGRFYFAKGTNERQGAVIFSNRSADDGSTVSVDAIRLGGGVGLMERGGGPSGQRRADECSRYHAQFSGAPGTVYNASTSNDRTDDISTRSRFADWLHAPGEPAVFISHHTNAFQGTSRGTMSFIYGKNAVDGTYQPTAAALALGADKLAQAVHGEIVADLQTDWEASWKDRGVLSAYFGEINPAYQDEMPAMLIETAFHDNKEDAAALREAPFRQIVARAIYKGIVRYFADSLGRPTAFLPEPPRAVLARGSGPGKVTLSWTAPPFGGTRGDPALSYRVHRSSSGRGFDEGADTGGQTTHTVSGLTPGEVTYFRVTATNEGGSSLPSPVLAVAAPAAGTARVLLVSAFDRTDSQLNILVTYPKVNEVHRLFLEQMNDQSYLVEHGRAMAPAGLAFDACTHDAIEAEALAPADYPLVIWQGGRGLADGGAMGARSLAALSAAAAAGTSIVISSAVLARHAGAAGASAEARAFLEETLGAQFVAADELLSAVQPTGGGPLEGLVPWELSTWETGPYSVGRPDVIAPGPASVLAAVYGTPAAGAGVHAQSGDRCTVLLGFPLETVLPQERQREILQRLLDQCLPAEVFPDGGPVGDAGPGRDSMLPPSWDAGPELRGDDGCGCAVAEAPERRRPWVVTLLISLGLLLSVNQRRRRRRAAGGGGSSSGPSSPASSSP